MPQTHWLLLALAVTGSAVFLNAPTRADSPSLQTQIQTAYDKRDAALNHFDIEGFMSSYTDDYKNVGMGKPGTSDLQRLGVIRDFQHVQDMKIHETVQSVTPYNDGVTVTAVAVTTRMMKDPNTGRAGQRIATEQERAFWVHTKMGWRIKQERTLSRIAHDGALNEY